MRILIVEDDDVLRDTMARTLQQSGDRIDLAGTLDDARHWWRVQAYDAILLDLSLPVSAEPRSGLGSGLQVLREARSRGDQTPVIVLTARDRTEERIAGLDAGADDYLGKPFELSEVEARLRAMVRRARNTVARTQVSGLLLDRTNRRFTLDGEDWDLPAREFHVLWELMTPAGRVVSKRELSEKLSDVDDVLGDNALEASISRLRKKLEGQGVRIRTLRGLGYVLEAQE